MRGSAGIPPSRGSGQRASYRRYRDARTVWSCRCADLCRRPRELAWRHARRIPVTHAVQPREGSCLCGEVTYVVTSELRDVWNCHCERCRRFTGHHMAATATDVAGLVVRDPSASLRWFAPVADAEYAFCSVCGSSLFWRATSAAHRISICAGTLSPPTGLRTVQAWWVSQASDYHSRPALPERDTE